MHPAEANLQGHQLHLLEIPAAPLTTRFRNTFFFLSIGANSETASVAHQLTLLTLISPNLLSYQGGSHTFQLGSLYSTAAPETWPEQPTSTCLSTSSVLHSKFQTPLHGGAAAGSHLLISMEGRAAAQMSRRWWAPQPRRRAAISPPCQGFSFTGADPLDVTQAFASIRPLTSRIERFLSCFLSRKRMNIGQHKTTRIHARNFRSATITAILFWTAQASLCPCLSSPSTNGFFNG